ncbi:hypothetical protein Tco_0415732 [Tanacetum coccineum]
MPYPRFTKIIINHFLKQHKSLTNLNLKHYHTSVKDDVFVSILTFVRIGEDYQEYGLPIPDVMLTDAIKHSESYQMFIKYSTNQIPTKKSIGKAKKKTSSKRRVKKKVTLSADDNIISDDPDAALELAKSISQTEAEEAEAARKNKKLQTLCKLLRKVRRQAEDNQIMKANDHISDTQEADDERDKTESDEDDIYKFKIRVCKDEDVEMKDAEVEESDKGEEKITDAAKE